MNVFPAAMGTEEEVRGVIYCPTNPDSISTLDIHTNGILSEAYDKVGQIGIGANGMLMNGGRAYNDGRGPELCTADVSNVEDHLCCLNATAELFMQSTESYLSSLAIKGQRPQTASIGRRVANLTAKGATTWACHDNFSLTDPDYATTLPVMPKDNSKLWNGFLRSRVFITGSGLVGNGLLHYSQKLSVDVPFKPAYDYKPRMVRLVDDGVEQRLEIACNDINLKEQACRMRVGGAALFLAATQTPLAKKFLASREFQYSGWGRFTNTIDINPEDFSFMPTPMTRQQLDIQYLVFSTILNQLEDAADMPIPADLKQVGAATIQFCKAYEKVLNNETDLATISSDADWAEKVLRIRNDLQDNPRHPRVSGIRSLYDMRAQDIDIAYDRTSIRASETGEITRVEGFGIRKAKQQSTLVAADVKKAMYSPPPDSRAARRVALAQKLGPSVKNCWWRYIESTDHTGETVYTPVNL